MAIQLMDFLLPQKWYNEYVISISCHLCMCIYILLQILANLIEKFDDLLELGKNPSFRQTHASAIGKKTAIEFLYCKCQTNRILNVL